MLPKCLISSNFKENKRDITAIAQPIEEIGKKAVELLFGKHGGSEEGYEQIRLEAELVVRDSDYFFKKLKRFRNS